ncbi:MAG: hypothetical protein IKP66_03155 [Lachnospiraceae bacterium]|nr:hypothetical protein [Lachnospiraceae bacterium]
MNYIEQKANKVINTLNSWKQKGKLENEFGKDYNNHPKWIMLICLMIGKGYPDGGFGTRTEAEEIYKNYVLPWKEQNRIRTESKNINRINEIGDTPKGQEILGRTAERAYQRANRTSGADKNRYMKTYNDAYRTSGKSANKHLGGSREHFDNGRDYEYEKWADEHNGNVTESKTMNRKLIRLTESDIHNIVRESVNRTLEEISEGSAFSHSNDEWGKDYFVNAKALARGIYDILKAMEDEGNSNDYRSTTYLYHELERRVIELNQTYKLIKHYISGFKQPQAPL